MVGKVEAAIYPNAVLRNGHVILRVDRPLAGLRHVFGGVSLRRGQRGAVETTTSLRTLMAVLEAAVVSLVRCRGWRAELSWQGARARGSASARRGAFSGTSQGSGAATRKNMQCRTRRPTSPLNRTTTAYGNNVQIRLRNCISATIEFPESQVFFPPRFSGVEM